jgi:hypothetical protein
MGLQRFWIVILIMVSACSPEHPQRLVMISMRGVSAEDVRALTQQGILKADGGFLTMSANGFAADYLEPIYNPETAPEMATFESGAWPSRHGIVGNTFYRNNPPASELQYGYQTPLESETLWEASARQGKKVIRIGSLFAGTVSGVFSLAQGEALGEAQWPLLKSTRPAGSRTESFEYVRPFDSLQLTVESDSVWRRSMAVHLIDTVFDGRESYSAILLDGEGRQRRLHASQWAAIELSAGIPRIGVWIKVMSIQNDSVRFYVRPPFRNRGSPSEFVERVERLFGFCPGYPDIAAYVSGKIDAETLKEEIHRETFYAWRSAEHFLTEKNFDLMIVDYPLLDRYGHAFYDPGLTDSTNVWIEAYRHADRHLLELFRKLPSNTGLMVSSGYGFYSSSRQIAFGGKPFAFPVALTDDVEMAVSSVSAHVYLRGDSVREFSERLIDFFTALTDPSDSTAVVAEVRRSPTLDSLGLFHPQRSGHLWVRLNPGYTFRSDWKSTLSIAPSRFHGEHGYRGERSRGVFYYTGPSLSTPRSRVLNAVDVTVTASALLGLKPPRGSQGVSIFYQP